MKSTLVLALTGLAAAHSAIRSMQIDGITYAPYQAIIDDLLPSARRIEWTHSRNYFQKSANSPVNDVADPALACGVGPGAPRLKAVARAGATVNAGWTDIIPMHVGPVLAYMAKIDVPSINRFNPTEFSWFKVYQDGFDSESGLWANERVRNNDNMYSFKIPSDIAPGLYTIRTELIALHGNGAGFNSRGIGAGTFGGFQSYAHCFNVQVTGNGTKVPEGVRFPGGYSWDDQGITFYPFRGPDRAERVAKNKDYIIPGPPVYDGLYNPPEGPAPNVTAADRGAYPLDIQVQYDRLADRVYKFSKDGIVEIMKWWPVESDLPVGSSEGRWALPPLRLFTVSAQSIAGILYDAVSLRRAMFAAGLSS